MAEAKGTPTDGLARLEVSVRDIMDDPEKRLRAMIAAGATLVVIIILIVLMPFSITDGATARYKAGLAATETSVETATCTSVSEKGVLTVKLTGETDKGDTVTAHLADVTFSTLSTSDGATLKDEISHRIGTGTTVWLEKADADETYYVWLKDPSLATTNAKHDLLQSLVVADGWALPKTGGTYDDALSAAHDAAITASSKTNATWDSKTASSS